MVSLTTNDETNPLTEYADLISPGGSDSADRTGLSSVEVPDDPTEIHQLSQQAWDKMHPQGGIEDGESAGASDYGSAGGGSGGDLGGGGGSAAADVGNVPEMGDITFGSREGGNFVSDDATAAEKIVRTAKAMLGKPYIWGGEDWNGADCSGLVQLAYAQAGIEMPRLSNYQMNKGKRVPYKDLKPGDLVGWNNSGHVVGADHIAIYIGNGQIIEAPRPGTNIRVAGLYDYDVAEMWAVRIPGKHVAAQAPVVPVTPRRRRLTYGPATSGSARVAERAATQSKSTPTPATRAGVHSTGALAAIN